MESDITSRAAPKPPAVNNRLPIGVCIRGHTYCPGVTIKANIWGTISALLLDALGYHAGKPLGAGDKGLIMRRPEERPRARDRVDRRLRWRPKENYSRHCEMGAAA